MDHCEFKAPKDHVTFIADYEIVKVSYCREMCDVTFMVQDVIEIVSTGRRWRR